jgi:hypothetical protein
MAALTYGELWRQFHLEHPAIDALLCRQWVLDAYKRACTGQQWGFLRGEGQLVVLAARSVTVGVTQGSTSVTSTAAFVSGDGGRQLRVASRGIPFTLTFSTTSLCALDRTYEGDTNAAASASIFDAYATMPADFDSFRSLINPTVQRPMPWMLSREVLDYRDPDRTATDSTARMLVSHRMSGVSGQTGRLLYEWWPYPTARAAYPMTYYKRVDALADTDSFVGVFSTRAEDLLCYARYRAAMYPGTPERRNPGYSVAAAQEHKSEWEQVVTSLGVRDDDQFAQMIEQIDWTWVNGGLAHSDSLLRATDASGYEAWFPGGGHFY